MTPQEIKQIINEELKAEPDWKDVHGIDLSKSLIEPIKQTYVDTIDQSKSDIFWTVLEETSDKKGYKIFFDEQIKMFGLGMNYNNDKLINIGYHGSFLKTLQGM
jgi:uncharacterized protein YpuA (DUF1002 family)